MAEPQFLSLTEERNLKTKGYCRRKVAGMGWAPQLLVSQLSAHTPNITLTSIILKTLAYSTGLGIFKENVNLSTRSLTEE